MAIPQLLSNLKLTLRNQLGRKVLWANSRRDLVLTRESDLCVEGFPRSANTYSVLLIEKFASRPLNIAHHLHIPAQIKYAVEWGIPAVLLIRNPLEAIPSLVLREQAVTVHQALNWYNLFHADLVPLKEQLHIWRFDDLIAHPMACLRQLNHSLNLWNLEEQVSHSDNQEIFEEIDRLDRETKQGQDLSLVNSRPNARKGAAKQEILADISTNPLFQRKMDKATSLYLHFIS